MEFADVLSSPAVNRAATDAIIPVEVVLRAVPQLPLLGWRLGKRSQCTQQAENYCSASHSAAIISQKQAMAVWFGVCGWQGILATSGPSLPRR
jgi:hypothetical protein